MNGRFLNRDDTLILVSVGQSSGAESMGAADGVILVGARAYLNRVRARTVCK